MLLGSGPNSMISRLVIPPARNSARRAESSPSIVARRTASGEWPVPARVEHPLHDVVARVRDLQRLGEQVAVVVNDDAPRAEGTGERVVLGLCAAYPEHVVEEQVGSVIGGQALEFEVRSVQHHLPQAADLGIDMKHGHHPG